MARMQSEQAKAKAHNIVEQLTDELFEGYESDEVARILALVSVYAKNASREVKLQAAS